MVMGNKKGDRRKNVYQRSRMQSIFENIGYFGRSMFGHGHGDQPSPIRREFPIRIRLLFILSTSPVVFGSLVLMFISMSEPPNDQTNGPQSIWHEFNRLIHKYQSTVIFVSTCSFFINGIAIGAALFNWTTILFAYVVITGIVGTIIGVAAILGLIISCIMMSHNSETDHSIAITAIAIIILILIFYLLTILGLKLMSHLRRRSEMTNFNDDDDERKRYQYNNGSPVNRRSKTRSYKSIDSISSPLASNYDIEKDEEQELSHVYVNGFNSRLSSSSSSQQPEPSRTSFNFNV